MSETKKNRFTLPVLLVVIAVIIAVTAGLIFFFYNREIEEKKEKALKNAKDMYMTAQTAISENRKELGAISGVRKFSSLDIDEDTLGGKINKLGEFHKMRYECEMLVENSYITEFTYDDFENDVVIKYKKISDTWKIQ
ncbi:type II secretion system GspH family protein [Lachnospiraceae bacterium OttesenSCG-928-J05]|nr:type II secretion system GspH family protein [Lachnospiraceae bacterium OttesenSCG-928-J05]